MRIKICLVMAFLVIGCSDSGTSNANHIAGPEALPEPGDTEFYSLAPIVPCAGNVNNVNNIDSPEGCSDWTAAAVATGSPGETVAYVNGQGMRITNLSTGDSSVMAYDGCLTYAGATDDSYFALVNDFRGIVNGRYVHEEPAIVVAAASASLPESAVQVLEVENIAGGIVEGDLLKVVAWDGENTVLLEFPLSDQELGEPSTVTLSDQELRSAWIVDERLVVRFGDSPKACVVSSGPNSMCVALYPTTTKEYSFNPGNDLIALRDDRALVFGPEDDQMSLFVDGEMAATSTVDLGASPLPGSPPILLDDFAVVLLQDGTWTFFEISGEDVITNSMDLGGAPSVVVAIDGNRLVTLGESAALLEASAAGLTELSTAAPGFEPDRASTLFVEPGGATIAISGTNDDAFLRVQGDQLTSTPGSRGSALQRDGVILSLNRSSVQSVPFDGSMPLELDFDTVYALARNEDLAVRAVLTRASNGAYESHLEIFEPQDIDTILATIPLTELSETAALVLNGNRLAIVGAREIETDSQWLEVWDLEDPSNPTQEAASRVEGAPLATSETIYFHSDFLIQEGKAVGFDGEVISIEEPECEERCSGGPASFPFQADGRFFFHIRRTTDAGLAFELFEVNENLELADPVNIPGELIHLDGTTGIAYSRLEVGSAISVFELDGGVATLTRAGLLDGEVLASRVASDGARAVGSGEDLYELELESMTATTLGEATTQVLQVDGDRLITTSQPDFCTSGLQLVGYLSSEDGTPVSYHNANDLVGDSTTAPKLEWGTPMLAVDVWGRLLRW